MVASFTVTFRVLTFQIHSLSLFWACHRKTFEEGYKKKNITYTQQKEVSYSTQYCVNHKRLLKTPPEPEDLAQIKLLQCESNRTLPTLSSFFFSLCLSFCLSEDPSLSFSLSLSLSLCFLSEESLCSLPKCNKT